jgi:hypothetical protein
MPEREKKTQIMKDGPERINKRREKGMPDRQLSEQNKGQAKIKKGYDEGS